MVTRGDLLKALERAGIGSEQRESGNCWMIIAPSLGARILGAGIGEENAFWVPSVISRGSWSHGGNAGGQRTWIAPEAGPRGFFFASDSSRWEVLPDLDPGDYRHVAVGIGWMSFRNSFTARAADNAAFAISLTRSMSLGECAGAVLRIRCCHDLENVGSVPIDKRIGLWSILQLPSIQTGTILIPLLPDPGAGRASTVRPYFSDLPLNCLDWEGSTICLKTRIGLKYKIGVRADLAAGRIAFLRRSRLPGKSAEWMLVAMRFPVDPEGTYLDKPFPAKRSGTGNGDAVQAYNDAGQGDDAFCEIEAHAPAIVLGPGEHQSQEIEIVVAAGGKEEILEIVRREVTAGVPADRLFTD